MKGEGGRIEAEDAQAIAEERRIAAENAYAASEKERAAAEEARIQAENKLRELQRQLSRGRSSQPFAQ